MVVHVEAAAEATEVNGFLILREQPRRCGDAERRGAGGHTEGEKAVFIGVFSHVFVRFWTSKSPFTEVNNFLILREHPRQLSNAERRGADGHTDSEEAERIGVFLHIFFVHFRTDDYCYHWQYQGWWNLVCS